MNINKNALIIFSLVFGFLIGHYAFSPSVGGDENTVAEVKKEFYGNYLSSTDKITCYYPQIMNASYANKEISLTLPKPEKNQLVFTFNLNEDSRIGELSFIDSTQSINTVPVVIVAEDADKIVLLDGGGDIYLSTHTIYKKKGVATYTKTVDLLGIASGSLSIGTCVDY